MNEKDKNGNMVKQNGHFLPNSVQFFPVFNHATAVLWNRIRNFTLSPTVFTTKLTGSKYGLFTPHSLNRRIGIS